MARASAKLEIAFAGTPGSEVTATALVWTDVTSALWSFNARRGRQHELDRTEAGTLTAVLDNRTRAFDPTFSSSPYATGLLPLRPVRLSFDLNATNYPWFTGYVEAWTQQYGLAAIPVVELRAVDGFKILSLSGLRGSTFAAENTETRLTNVLAAIGWNATNTSSTGARSFQAAADFTSQDGNALEHLQAAVQAEQGRLFMTHHGKVRFYHRHVPYTSTTPAYTYDETVIRGLEFEFSDANVWNKIDTQKNGGTLHSTGDTATSQVRYLKRTLTRTGLPLDDDNEPEDLGGFLLTNYKDPAQRITGINVQGEQPTTTYRDAVLDRELGHRVVVDYEPRTSSAETISQESFIEALEVQGQRGALPQFRLGLSPIGISFTLGAPWILASATGSTDGIIGTNTVLRY